MLPRCESLVEALFLLTTRGMPCSCALRAHRGFTLVEMLTAVAIIGVLAGMSAVALDRMKSRGNFASATGDFIATLRTARAEAFARGNPTVVVVDTANRKWWAVEDVNGDFA